EWRKISAKAHDLEAPHSERQCGEKADGPGAENRRALRPPDLQPTLGFVRLDDAFLDDRSRFEQHFHMPQSLRDLHHVLRIFHKVLSKISVAEIDPALEVHLVGGHVVLADLVVKAAPRASHGRHDVIARLEFRDVLANLDDATETLMADH